MTDIAPKLKPEVKAAWVAALRSGEYEQGTGRLASFSRGPEKKERFCCLGVLCEVAIKSADDSPIRRVKEKLFGSQGTTVYFYDGETSHLPLRVTTWAWGGGLRSKVSYGDPAVMYEGDVMSLSILNDKYHLNFDEIADIIEEQL
jgi:hypothetical protein